MTRLELPSGGWVEWRDPASVTEKQRRPFRMKMMALSKDAQAIMGTSLDEEALGRAMMANPADVELMWDISDIVAATMVATASFVPDGQTCTVDDITGLTGQDYEAVTAGAAPFVGTFSGVDFSRTSDDRSATNPT